MASGENVSIRGSERIEKWVKQNENIWMVVTPLDITTNYLGNSIDPENVMPGSFKKNKQQNKYI